MTGSTYFVFENVRFFLQGVIVVFRGFSDGKLMISRKVFVFSSIEGCFCIRTAQKHSLISDR